MADSLAAIVLAGGQSSRLGQDKALILVQGMALLRRTCEVALACTSQVYVVTPRPEIYQPLLPPQCQLVLEQPLSNELQPHGPLVGFAQGLGVIPTKWVLLLACDLPYLQADLLQHWMQQLDALEPAIAALLPRHEQGWEPLCGFYRANCLPRLNAFIQQGGRSFQHWLAQEVVQEIVFSPTKSTRLREQQMLFNCNTPTDLEEIMNS
ncbi:molybdenum cofactor guanylyltransferase [Leptodesmis sp.]|uniref:molybdenum cofactor guanylyltransferase n=1 Tax=Leptodesmis sp. TaxID=3100501 RepID=UPI00405353A8